MCVCVETVYSRGAIRNLTLQPWHRSSMSSGNGLDMRRKTAVAIIPDNPDKPDKPDNLDGVDRICLIILRIQCLGPT